MLHYRDDVSELKPRVLIVERSDEIRTLQRAIVRKALSPLETEIIESASAESMVEQFRTEPFHLLLVDASPSQNREAVRELVRASKVRQRCPSIAFSTGRIDRETLKSLADDHCFAIFPKPFEPQDVASAIEESIRAHAKSVDAVLSPVLHGVLAFLHRDEKQEP
jgi:CheY-like chemotaxis protein